MMKSQDIVLLLKLVSLDNQLPGAAPAKAAPDQEQLTVRALADATGISKSEVSAALHRCMDAGLAKPDRNTGTPRVNTKALYELLAYGIKYVFPAKPGGIVRGMPTAHAAPVFKDKLMSAGEHICVWEDAQGQHQGQAIPPLFKSVPMAAQRDEQLYAMLALVDAIRIGQEREAALARELLARYLGRSA